MQVYKGKLKTGETVAVKVQRPYVLETVTIDLFIIRKLGTFMKRFPEVRTRLAARAHVHAYARVCTCAHERCACLPVHARACIVWR